MSGYFCQQDDSPHSPPTHLDKGTRQTEKLTSAWIHRYSPPGDTADGTQSASTPCTNTPHPLRGKEDLESIDLEQSEEATQETTISEHLVSEPPLATEVSPTSTIESAAPEIINSAPIPRTASSAPITEPMVEVKISLEPDLQTSLD